MAHLDFAKLESPKDKEILQHIEQVRGSPFSEIWLTMLHHPVLTREVSDLGQTLRFEGTLPGAIRDILILYIASRCHTSYEWAAHVALAKKEGIPEEVFSLLKTRCPFSAFPEPYRDALEAAQTALDKKSLPAALQNQLVSQYQTKGLVEIVLLVGYYQMLASFLNAFEIKVTS